MIRRTPLCIGALGVVLGAVLTMPAAATLTEGSKPPALSVKTTAGKTIDLGKLKGKVVLIDFWATWCPPCRAEIPMLQRLHKKYASQGLRVVGVSIGEGQERPAAFAKQNGMTYSVAYTGEKQARTIGEQFDFSGIPTTYIVDKHGVIRFAETGIRPDSERALEMTVKRLLAEKTRR